MDNPQISVIMPVYNRKQYLSDDIALPERLQKEIDWERVNTIRNFEREKSLSFLRKNLNYD